MKKLSISLILTVLFASQAFAQLKPGFEAEEYLQLLGVFTHGLPDSTKVGIPSPKDLEKIYDSPVVGLENKWSLWVQESEKIAVIAIRGTVQSPTSWLANFYAAMIPASGSMKIRDDYTFKYDFAKNPKAAVHVGWTFATAALSETMTPKIDSLIANGYQDFIIAGHSQGGAIAYLVSAMLNIKIQSGSLPAKIRVKTYCSAAPKPGNLYFAYDYEYMNQGGWAFNVVNASDWVPEVPFSVQTVDDFNSTNPFSDVSGIIKAQKFPRNLILKKVYKKLDKPTKKSTKNFQKFLGKYAGKQVLKLYPDYESPAFFPSNHFVRVGNFIVLLPDEEYKIKYPDEEGRIFKHHMFNPYYFLFKKQYLD
jgi:pimeloyl-ACP methyl ester carboxylesterase